MSLKQLVHPTTVLSLFFFLLPWQTRYIFGLSYLSGAPTEFATLSLYATQAILLVGLGLAYAVHGTPSIDKRYRLSLGLGGLILVSAAVSSLLAHWSIPALAGMIDVAFASLAFAALLDKRVEVKMVMRWFMLGLVIPVFLGIVQVLSGGNGASTLLGLASRDAERPGDVVTMINGSRVLRAYGPFPHPNIFGGYLAVALAALCSVKAFASDPRLMKWRAIMGTLLGIGLALTLSRAAVLGLVLGLALAFLVTKMKNTAQARRLVIPVAAVVIAAALCSSIFAPHFVASLRGGGRLEEQSLSERKDQYKEWLATMHGSDWLIGNGPRNYVFALADEYPQRTVWDYQPVHNVPLLILSEIGLLGLIMIFLWSSSIDTINFARFPGHDAVAAFAMGNVILVILFFDHYLWSAWAGLALVAYVMALTLRLGEAPSR